ncbi:hypothetical protein [Candidatus Frankia alpina]|uniref:hypothetical protein n=1 Tax=Candidatus Frankia alpina TaxID=2699483 RepID=UPI001F16BA07|nr:hypothetical protein [Candidatus Frankia alpina]
MAREVISLINVWCDNAGRHAKDKVAATQTAALAYDGRLVRLDLCDECRDEVASVLGEYAEYGETVDVARNAKIDTAWTAVEQNDAITTPEIRGEASRPAPAQAKIRRPHQSTSVSEVRAWLRDHADEHGLTVPERGPRLSGELKAAYDRGHGWDEIDGA